MALKLRHCHPMYYWFTKMHSFCAVNSALAGLQKLSEVKDVLGKIENAIGTFRGGKHSRLFHVNNNKWPT